MMMMMILKAINC